MIKYHFYEKYLGLHNTATLILNVLISACVIRFCFLFHAKVLIFWRVCQHKLSRYCMFLSRGDMYIKGAFKLNINTANKLYMYLGVGRG